MLSTTILSAHVTLNECHTDFSYVGESIIETTESNSVEEFALASDQYIDAQVWKNHEKNNFILCLC